MTVPLLRPARQDDAEAVRALAADCPPLEVYPLHQLKILLRYCGDVSLIAEGEGGLGGYVLGIGASRNPGLYFLWQIGVAPEQRRTGLGRRLLEYTERRVREAGYHTIELTVDPANEPSYRLFRSVGYTNVSRREDRACKIDGRWAAEDHYGPGRHFILLAKALDESEDES